MLPKQRHFYIDHAANILTIIVAIAFLALLVSRVLLPNKPEIKTPIVGNTVSVEGFDPSTSKRNLLLILMKGCRFCEGSMDFYKEVQRVGTDHQVNVIAVFPPKTEGADLYLERFGLRSIPIVNATLSDLDVSGTPTIILTDESGKLTNFWIGQLSKEKEAEVLSFISS